LLFLSTLHSPTSLHGLHGDFVRTLWTLWGVRDCISYNLHKVHVDSMWSLCRVQRDFHSPYGPLCTQCEYAVSVRLTNKYTEWIFS
jgi:hypothetical protein